MSQSDLFNLALGMDKVSLKFEAAVEVDEGFCLTAHLQQNIPFTKEALHTKREERLSYTIIFCNSLTCP